MQGSKSRIFVHFFLYGGAFGLILILLLMWMFFWLQANRQQTSQNTTSPTLAAEKNGKIVGTAQIDLNGDNDIDYVSLSMMPDADPRLRSVHPELTINDVSIAVPGTNSVGYFGIVDLNIHDGQHEIALSDLGPSDDYTTSFYTFDGKTIKFIGTTEGLYERMQFNGDGSFATTTRGHILDTWFYRDSFALTDDNSLVRVSKDFYERENPDSPVIVLMTIVLQKSPSDTRNAITLRKGDVVTIVGCDDIAWCQIMNAQGITGWFAVEDFYIIKDTGKPATDFFEGLSYAD